MFCVTSYNTLLVQKDFYSLSRKLQFLKHNLSSFRAQICHKQNSVSTPLELLYIPLYQKGVEMSTEGFFSLLTPLR